MADTDPTPVTLEFLAEQQRRILDELAGHRAERAGLHTELTYIRGDTTVLTAIANRQDSTLRAILDEVRAMRASHQRVADQLRRFADAEFDRRLSEVERLLKRLDASG